MKRKSTETLINEIANFFKLLHTESEASQEEVIIFLENSLQYIFNLNKLNINDFDISIHSKKPYKSDKKLYRLEAYKIDELSIPKYEKCFMFQDEKILNKFDVVFNSDDTIFKPNDHTIEDVADLMFYVFHEYAHIIEYILHFDRMELCINAREDIRNTTISKLNTYPNKQARKLFDTYEKYFSEASIMSALEKDMDSNSFTYCTLILQDVYKSTNDSNFKMFLNQIFGYLKVIKKWNKKYYKISSKQNKDSTKKLNDLGIDDHNFVNL